MFKNSSSTYGLAIISIGMLMLFSNCELPVDWETQPGDNGKLVIEAIVTDELKQQEVKLSLSYDDFNDEPEPVSDAVVYLFDGQNVIQFFEAEDQPGTFRSPEPLAAAVLTGYGLGVEYEGEQHIATSYMLPVLPMDTMTFQQVGNTDSLRIKDVAPIYTLHEEAMYEIDIDWTHLTGDESSRAKVFYYTFTSVNGGQLFSPGKEDVIFPRGSIVIEKKYSLNAEFGDYIRALVIETQWQGGVYEDDSGSLPTNFNNGALGYFGLCSVVCDTLVAE